MSELLLINLFKFLEQQQKIDPLLKSVIQIYNEMGKNFPKNKKDQITSLEYMLEIAPSAYYCSCISELLERMIE